MKPPHLRPIEILTKKHNRRNLLGATAAAMIGPQVLSTSPALATVASSLANTSDAQRAQGQENGFIRAVVSSHETATEAGLAILEEGGSAADAAITVAAVLTVVEGWFSSVLGGGTWALYYDAESGEITSIDGVGPTGNKATPEDYAQRASDLVGIHQSIVPGAWDGWMLWLERYGRFDLAEILEPAIWVAREGHPASDNLAFWTSIRQEQIFSNPATQRIYAPDGQLPVEGQTVLMPDLADTFDSLVDAYNAGLAESRSAAVQAARDYFYRGPLAEAIVAYSDEHGGYLTLDDFTNVATDFVEPISIAYDDEVTVYQNPPNSQGITMLLGLNILKGMGLASYDIDDPDAVHVQIEAMKLAFADRYHHIGDPDRIDIPVEELLSDDYAARQRERIDVNRTRDWPIASGLDTTSLPAHTTTFQLSDQYGNAASVTTSLGAQFLVIGDTGIHLNNRMRMLSVEEGNPNELTPGFKVRHTSCPYLAMKNGRPYILGGNTGNDTQPQGQLQQFISAHEFGLSAQGAISRPRWVTTAFPSGTPPWTASNHLDVQSGFSQEPLAGLEAKGHVLVFDEGVFGSAGMLMLNEDGTEADLGSEPHSNTASGEIAPEDQ
jgi:gamma-glutamyltranspeptidase / glutathione hydrolase